MALRKKSPNIQMEKSLSFLKPKVNLAVTNKNMLPGKSIATNRSKISTRSVIGLVHVNSANKHAIAVEKSSIPMHTSVLHNSDNTNSTFSLNQNVGQLTKSKMSSSACGRISKALLDKTSECIRDTVVKQVVLQQPVMPAKHVISLTASNASVSLENTKVKSSREIPTSGIDECEPNLQTILVNNVSLEEDFDEKDVSDPFQLGDYAKDIFNYLFHLENKYLIRKDYLKNRAILPRYRTILVDYMVDLQLSWNLLPESLFLAVYMVDKYLELEPSLVTKFNLQCVGVTAMYLASKYEEVKIPAINEFANMTGDSMSVKDILCMEVFILKALNFDLNRPNPLAFLRRFSKVAKADVLVHSYSKYFIELALNDYSLVHEKPSTIAAASLYLAHVVIKSDEQNFWTRQLIHHTRYTEQNMMPVIFKIARAIVENTEEGERTAKFKAIKEKYSKCSHFRVSVSAALTVSSPTLCALATKASD